jgi:hypothetical protein
MLAATAYVEWRCTTAPAPLRSQDMHWCRKARLRSLQGSLKATSENYGGRPENSLNDIFHEKSFSIKYRMFHLKYNTVSFSVICNTFKVASYFYEKLLFNPETATSPLYLNNTKTIR